MHSAKDEKWFDANDNSLPGTSVPVSLPFFEAFSK